MIVRLRNELSENERQFMARKLRKRSAKIQSKRSHENSAAP